MKLNFSFSGTFGTGAWAGGEAAGGEAALSVFTSGDAALGAIIAGGAGGAIGEGA